MPHHIELLGARQLLLEWKESQHLTELIETIEQALKNDSDKVIDAAKCLIEAVCKTILKERGVEYSSVDTVAGLVRKTTQALGINEEDGGSSLRDMVRGMTSATQGLSQIRNDFGPLAHGRVADHRKLGDWHRLMAVRTAETIVVLLFEAHAHKTIDFRLTSRPFDENDPENRKIDMAAEVQYDLEAQEVVINEFIRLRPSEILYALDRGAYVDERIGVMGEAVEGESRDEGAGTESTTRKVTGHRAVKQTIPPREASAKRNMRNPRR